MTEAKQDDLVDERQLTVLARHLQSLHELEVALDQLGWEPERLICIGLTQHLAALIESNTYPGTLENTVAQRALEDKWLDPPAEGQADA